MAPWLCVILLVAVWKGIHSQSVVLTQGGSELKKPGESVKLKCATSGFVLNDYYTSWIRQKPGGGLQWLVRYWKASATNYYLPAIQNRFTASKDSSNFYLQMNDLAPEDTAVYYCALDLGGGFSWGAFDYWGQGTQVTVSSASPTRPTVFPLIPPCRGPSTASQVTIGCLVTGYFPEPVSVNWNPGAISTGVRTFPAIRHSSGFYTLCSQLTIPSSRWQSDERFQCNVVHTPTSSTINKQVEPCKPPPTTPPSVPPVVNLLHSSCNSQSPDATIDLLCRATSFYPKEVKVEWLAGDDKTGVLTAFTEAPRKDENGHTFSTISTASVSQSDWQDGTSYTCLVSHPATGVKVKSTARICEGSSEIRVFILPPDPNDVFVERQPKLTCVATNLESDAGLEMSWARQRPAELITEPLEVKDELNGTLTAFSRLVTSDQAWLSGETFTCTVKHPSLPQFKIARISKKKEPTAPPNVYLFRPHHEELISNSRHVSITALVKGFKPSEISLNWLKGNELLPRDNFVITPVLSDGDGTYVVFSKLRVPKSDWNRGDSYSCMVVHEGLRMRFIQKNIEKPQGKK